MIVVDAYWEEKNLGVSTAEISFENSDTLDDVKLVLAGIEKQYFVCKVPSNRADILFLLQQMGYTYIEDQIEVEHDLHHVERTKVMQRLYDSLDYRLMNNEDIANLYDEINKGMFANDRISLDPYFAKGLSAQRYTNWIKDMLDKGAMPYLFSYKNEPAGFIILTTKDYAIYNSVLGGGYSKFRKTGLGIIQKEMEIVKKLGGNKVITSVSSNNANQVKALVMNGYLPVGIKHILIKHS